MRYVFHREDLPLKEKVCLLNDVDPSMLDVSDFKVDEDIDVLNAFKEYLLSLADKRFFIVGDYDCDGICATAIMKKLFDDLGIACNYYIPSRSKEGYGLNKKIVETAFKNHFDVLLCVDNGIIANEALAYAKENGLITLVIDHHEYESAPEADAYLHPDLFPEKYADMCASGLSCLLSQSIRKDELTMVYGGLATLADMVKVFGYNRYLLVQMKKLLNESFIAPIAYLTKSKQIDYETLSFDVIPKINAVSRMDDMLNVNYVVRYLLSDKQECVKYLSKIEEINTLRKQLTKEMAGLAQRIADTDKQIIVVCSDAFKEGLCGLIANRLMNEYGKPVIILSKSEGLCKGSGRAPKGFDLHECLMGISDLFSAFGGHAQAVGLSIEEDKLPEFQNYLNEQRFIFEEPLKDVLSLKIDEIDMNVLDELDELKPFGQGFEEPVIAIEDCHYKKKYLIAKAYPKFVLSEVLEAISFNPKDDRKEFTTAIGHLKKDTYHNGRLSFVIEDLVSF